MSFKLGTILSMLFVALFFLFGTDMITLQYAYSDLDAKSTPISYSISRHGGIDNAFIQSIENEYSVNFICLNEEPPLFGDTVDYIISTTYKPIIISKEEMTISIKRKTVIGFLG